MPTTTIRSVQLDYVPQNYVIDDPVRDAQTWIREVGAVVIVGIVQVTGPAGHPVLSFSGTKAEVTKVLEAYYADAPNDLAEALARLG
jgi:hypothetical protein